MALSDDLFDATERLRFYAEDALYIRLYGYKVIARAKAIAQLCDDLRKELDALPATEMQHENSTPLVKY